MDVNDNACNLNKRGAFESIAGKPAPTGIVRSLPAMVANDNACNLDNRGALESIASKPAPTGTASSVIPGIDAVFWTDPKMLDGLLPHAH
jgi:hypothetical protein